MKLRILSKNVAAVGRPKEVRDIFEIVDVHHLKKRLNFGCKDLFFMAIDSMVR